MINGPKGYSPNPKFQNCCGIYSIALATDANFNDVKLWFKNRNNRPGNWRGTTFVRDYPAAIKAFGKNTKKHSVNKIPLRKWICHYADPNKTYLCITGNHTMLLKDLHLHDQDETKHYSLHCGAGYRVETIYEIL